VDFKNTVIIMTSNAGVDLIRRESAIGFTTKKEDAKTQEQRYEDMKKKVTDEVKKTFRPEFINRLDDIMVFHELTEEQLRSIVDLMTADLQERLGERKVTLEMTDAAKSWLAKVGFDPLFGARPLRRAVERYVENPLSTKVLRGEFNEGDKVLVDLADDVLTFISKAGKAAKTAKTAAK